MVSETMYRAVWGLVIGAIVCLLVVILHSRLQTAQAREHLKGEGSSGHVREVHRAMDEAHSAMGT